MRVSTTYFATVFTFWLLVACGFVLSSCATVTRPDQSIYAVEASYQAALTVEVAYRNLPRCNGVTKICHEPSVVQQMIAADNVTYTAIKSAVAIAADPRSPSNALLVATQAAEAALAILQNLVSKVIVK